MFFPIGFETHFTINNYSNYHVKLFTFVVAFMLFLHQLVHFYTIAKMNNLEDFKVHALNIDMV